MYYRQPAGHATAASLNIRGTSLIKTGLFHVHLNLFLKATEVGFMTVNAQLLRQIALLASAAGLVWLGACSSNKQAPKKPAAAPACDSTEDKEEDEEEDEEEDKGDGNDKSSSKKNDNDLRLSAYQLQGEIVSFEGDIKALIDKYCTEACHQDDNDPSQPDLRTWEAVKKVQDKVAATIAGETKQMPPGGGMSDAEVAKVARWKELNFPQTDASATATGSGTSTSTSTSSSTSSATSTSSSTSTGKEEASSSTKDEDEDKDKKKDKDDDKDECKVSSSDDDEEEDDEEEDDDDDDSTKSGSSNKKNTSDD